MQNLWTEMKKLVMKRNNPWYLLCEANGIISLKAIYIGWNLFNACKKGTLPSEVILLVMQWYPEFVIVFHPVRLRTGLSPCPALLLLLIYSQN